MKEGKYSTGNRLNKELEIAISIVCRVWEGKTVRRSWTGVRYTGHIERWGKNE